MSIIDNIILSNAQKTAAKQDYMNTLKKEVNFTNFFTEDDEKGFTSKEVFLNELRSLGKYDRFKLEDFFSKLRRKDKLYISAFAQREPGKDMKYHLVKPILKNVKNPFYKLPVITGMTKLIACYARDCYTFKLSLKELVKHAKG